jgi:ATP-binding cassette subfamily B protein
MTHVSLILSYFKNHKLLIFCYTIFILLTIPLESIVIPQIYSNFFDSIKKNTSPYTFIKYIALLTVFFSVINIANCVTSYIDSIMIPNLNEYIVNYLYRNILVKYESQFEELELGKLVSRIINIPYNIRNLISETCIILLPRGITIFCINLYFFYLNWKLGLVSTILLLLFFYFNLKYLYKCGNLSRKRYTIDETKNQVIQDKISNLYSIYSTGNLEKEINEYKDNYKILTSSYKSNLTCVLHSTITTSVLLIILFITLNGTSTYLYFKKEISIVYLMAILITTIYYIPCITAINAIMPDIMQYYGVILKLDDFVKDLIQVQNEYNKSKLKKKNKKPVKINKPEIHIQNLSFQYPNTDIKLFNNFNLRIKNFEKIAITGPSGNGKSTILKLIMGYYKVADNTIFIDGIDINHYNLSELRSKISYVNQNTRLFNMTILENIQYGNDFTRSDIEKLCKRLNVDNIFQNLENGLDTNVGVNGEQLSGGQKQMIHILRCIGKKNKIVILDEPTSAIDKYNTKNIVKALEEISKDCTLILITHDDDILHLIDRVIYIDQGIIKKDYINSKKENISNKEHIYS